MSEPILKVSGLYKSYKGGYPVLKDLNLELPEGKIIGLLGPNGCGKSTLMKLVAGLLIPDEGEITVAGEPRSEATCALVSFLPERTYFAPSMRVCELIEMFEEFYSDFDSERARALMAGLKIDTGARLKTLSKGNKEKVQLIMVMSRRARLYLLDEPIAGVDPAARDYILGTVIGNYAPGATVVITTHLIHDIEPVLNEFYFMGKGGQILMSGDCERVRQEKGKTINELFKEVFA